MNIKSMLTISALALGLATVPASAGVKVGTLSCDVEPGFGFIIGSSKDLSCTYYGMDGTETNFVGTVGKLGLDIGYTSATRIVWAVVAPGSTAVGSLSGSYTGVNAEATLGVGVGANALIGGMGKSINLQPISVQGQAGLNLAAAVSSIKLKAVK